MKRDTIRYEISGAVSSARGDGGVGRTWVGVGLYLAG